MNHKDLARALRISDQAVIDKLMVGIHDANNCQSDLATLYKPGLTLKQMREEMEKLQRALRKIAISKGTIEAASSSIKAALKEIPPQWLQYLDSLNPELEAVPFDPAKKVNSGFHEQALALKGMSEPERQQSAERLLAVVTEFLDDMRTPGKGNARKQAKHYIPGIQCLMAHFRAALPDHKITSNPETKFWIYVKVWLEQLPQASQTDADVVMSPERHIDAAIADVSNWKKISL